MQPSLYMMQVTMIWVLLRNKSSAMEVLEFAKMFKHKGADSPIYNNWVGNIYNNQTRSSEMTNFWSNQKYTNLKNYNWIKEHLGDNSVEFQTYDRPGTRGGRHEMESSFQEKNMNQDLIWDIFWLKIKQN